MVDSQSLFKRLERAHGYITDLYGLALMSYTRFLDTLHFLNLQSRNNVEIRLIC